MLRNRYEKGGAAMTRQEAVDRLCDVYAGSYDVTRCEENEHALAATMDFYATAEKYVLSKKAKLWQANSFEYVYLFNVPHLTKEIYERCEKLAYEQGMARIQPNSTHMYTYITALFVCDSCDEDARKALKRCKLYKSFKLSYWGWMDFHTGLVVLPEERSAPMPADIVQHRFSKEACFISKRNRYSERRELYECCVVPYYWLRCPGRRLYLLRRLAGQEVGRG